MFFTACIDVIANFANPEPKETSKMIDIINSDLKKVIHFLLFTYQCMILDLIMPIYAIFSVSIKFRYCEKATKFEKNLPPFFLDYLEINFFDDSTNIKSSWLFSIAVADLV